MFTPGKRLIDHLVLVIFSRRETMRLLFHIDNHNDNDYYLFARIRETTRIVATQTVNHYPLITG